MGGPGRALPCSRPAAPGAPTHSRQQPRLGNSHKLRRLAQRHCHCSQRVRPAAVRFMLRALACVHATPMSCANSARAANHMKVISG